MALDLQLTLGAAQRLLEGEARPLLDILSPAALDARGRLQDRVEDLAEADPLHPNPGREVEALEGPLGGQPRHLGTLAPVVGLAALRIGEHAEGGGHLLEAQGGLGIPGVQVRVQDAGALLVGAAHLGLARLSLDPQELVQVHRSAPVARASGPLRLQRGRCLELLLVHDLRVDHVPVALARARPDRRRRARSPRRPPDAPRGSRPLPCRATPPACARPA